MKTQLTDRQEEILNFIQQFTGEMGYPPTLREIAKHFGISSTFGVKRHLDALVKKGYLNIEGNSSRAISLVKHGSSDNENKSSLYNMSEEFSRIPIVGRVAAGSPILAEQNIEGAISVDATFIKHARNSFALKVKGDSMINAGIFEGDLVIVSSQKEAVNGDIVVAMLGDEVTVKTFQNRNNKILLIPENENYQPIEIPEGKELSILGRVVGVIRWIS
ncbi:MAG: transcriptional repressor LexA [Ignavibacteriaceae bacterium]